MTIEEVREAIKELGERIRDLEMSISLAKAADIDVTREEEELIKLKATYEKLKAVYGA